MSATTAGMTSSTDTAILHWSDYLRPERVLLVESVSSQKKLLDQLADILAENHISSDGTAGGEHAAAVEDAPDGEDIFEALLERERMGSTALGKGIALPHARVDNLDGPRIAVARLAQALDIETPDNLPVDVVIALAIPRACTDKHLKILASISADMTRDEKVGTLRAANSAKAIMQLVQRWA